MAAAAGPLRNTIFGLITQATTSAFTAGLTIYLAHSLGRSGYGVFTLALSTGTLALLACEVGVSFSAARYIAESFGDRGAVADVAAAALRLNLIAGLVSAAGLWLLAGPIARAFGQTALTWPIRGVALAVFGQSVLLLYLRIFAAIRRVALTVRVVFAESLVETGASIALVLLGAGASGAAFGRAIGYAVGGSAALIVAARAMGRRAVVLRPGGSARAREIARYAGPLLITNSAYTLYATIDGLLIGAILSTGQVGLFTGPARFVVFLGYLGESVGGAVAPRVAPNQRERNDVRAWTQALRWLIVFQALLVAPLLVWPRQIVTLLLGSQFSGATEVIRVFALYAFLAGISPMISVSVNYLGQARRRIPIVLLSLAVNAALDVLLLPLIGVLGAAIGTTVAYAIYVPAHLRICRSVFEVPLRPLAATLARSALAAAAFCAVLVLVGIHHLSPVQWVVGLMAGSAAYAGVLLLTREVRLEELQQVRGVVRRRLART